MKNSSKQETTKQIDKSGEAYNKCLSYFEEIQYQSEEIGKTKLEPFNIEKCERIRTLYKKNEKQFHELIEVIANELV